MAKTLDRPVPWEDDQQALEPSEEQFDGKRAPSPSMSGLYRAAWRWHFYAGLFVIPVLLVLAVTGMIYLFKPQIEPMLYRDKMRVPLPAEGTKPVPYGDQVAAVENAYPQYRVVSVQTPTYPTRSTQVNITRKGGQGADQWTGVDKFVFVNPYTGAVLGDLNAADTFMADVRELHGNLMVGGQEGVGDRIVELTASWGVILVASGFYLWWRGRKPRKAQRASGPLRGRPLTRNRHALIGALAGGFLALFIVSGLPWSSFWGNGIGKIATTTGTDRPELAEDATTSKPPVLNKDLAGGNNGLPWATELLAVPSSDPGGQPHHGGAGATPSDAPASSKPQAIGIDRVIAIAGARTSPKHGVNVLMPEGETGVYTTNNTQPNNPHGNHTLSIDQYSGKVLSSVGFGDYGPLGKAISDGIALHEGRRFGAGNLWFNFLIVAGVIFLAVTGPMMWWKRRPKGAFAPPRRSTDPKTRRRLFWTVMLPIGILFPLGGITMLAVLALDWLVLRRIPRLARALGAA